MHVIAPEVGLLGTPPIVAASIPIAVGAALSSAIKGSGQISLSFFGDGATNEGVFYESLNFASLKKLPIVFICENNLYSTHMPISKILADTNIAKKAEGFGIPGFQIDGNNAIEVFQAVQEAAERARKGKGPTLLECLTYRWRGHVGPDDNIQGTHTDIRPQEELEAWKQRCPIKSLEKILFEQKIISESEKNQIKEKIEKIIEGAVDFAINSACPEKDYLSKDIFRA